MIGHISQSKIQTYKIKNHYLIQKQNPLYLTLVSARSIKYIVKTKHMSIRTSKGKAYRKIQIANNKLIKNHLTLSLRKNGASVAESYFHLMCVMTS